ncbi:LysR family transcriptional regulator [Pseudothauera rhizosphaerae]|uniref:LysR family transcriptional regulator n=1 Tax=Pseudothauera rhizosphaerae TaxID=2565932 RepID=A0A4S4AZ41_9RHOO|nr:LysR family transcriptional regulator [Pseudothauera rhizosphaerae]THF65283.1 LysR family transcriptional regulator [Pseudothauera rhizosphaerae]
MNIKIDDLVSFVATVHHQSLSRAAEALGLTQPAVTRRIQSLEESLGAVLLDRDTKPPKPNALGRRVFAQCEQVLREVDNLKALVETEAVPQGRLRLGVTQSAAEVGIGELLEAFRARYPALDVTVSTRWSGDLVKQVERGDLDAATVMLPRGTDFPPALAARHLMAVEMVVVSMAGSWPERPEPYRLHDLRHSKWIVNPDGCGFRARLQRALADLGLPFHVAMDAFGTELQLQLVAEGLGLGLATRAQIERSRYRDRIRVLPVTDFNPSTEMWLIHTAAPGNLKRPIELFAEAAVATFTVGGADALAA